MRQAYVISYDIADPKRWRKVYRMMLGVGEAIQYSVFRCDLSGSEKILLLEKLFAAIHQGEDRVMLIDLGPAEGDQSGNGRIQTFGRSLNDLPERGAVIL